MEPNPPRSRRTTLWISLLLVVIPLAVAVGRVEGMPTAEFLQDNVSLFYVARDVDRQLGQVVMVPLGAVVVVFFRVTLGITMLGPFRPILIALAVLQTGIIAGALFAAFVMFVVALVRPGLKNAALPYFSRLAILLMGVVVLQVALVILGESFDWEGFSLVAFFPIVVLCLTADGFARVLARDGLRPAAWRGATTLGIALVIVGIFKIPGCRELLFDHPELMLVEIACVLLISTSANFRLFEAPPNEGDSRLPPL